MPDQVTTLAALNAAPKDEFVSVLGEVVEHSS
jgi:hypothetical protein